MKFIKRKNIDTYLPKSQRFSVENDGRAIIDTNKSLTLPIGDTSERPGTGVPGMMRDNDQIEDFEVFTSYASWGWEKIRTDRPSDITLAAIGTGQGDGTVASINVLNSGSGYDPLNPPTITIANPDIGTDTAVVGTVTIVAGQITAVAIADSGSGYISVPTITISGVNQSAQLQVQLTGTLEYQLPVIPVNSQGNLSATNVNVFVENVFQLPGINYTLVLNSGNAFVRFDAPVPFGKPVYAIYGFDR